MWRSIILLLSAQLAMAGTIKIQYCNYDVKNNKISESGHATTDWNSPEKNRAVFEIIMLDRGAISLGVAENNYMHYFLLRATKSEMAHFEQPKFQRRLRFIVDDNDQSITSDQIVFRFEETVLVDSSKNLFSINYFALNKQEMHQKYGTTKSGLDLDKIDKRKNVKMIVDEGEDSVTYWVFSFFEETPPQATEAEKVYDNVHALISAPFVYAFQYQNYNSTLTFDRIAQDKPFGIPVAEGKNDTPSDDRRFMAELYCIILPIKYENEKLTVEIRLTNRLMILHDQSDASTKRSESYIKTIEFEKGDVIQLKLPNHWPGIIYKSTTEDSYSVGKGPKTKDYEPIFSPDVKDQYITIRPIKIM